MDWAYIKDGRKMVWVAGCLLAVGLFFLKGSFSSSKKEGDRERIEGWLSKGGSPVEVVSRLEKNRRLEESRGSAVSCKLLDVGSFSYPERFIKRHRSFLSSISPAYERFSDISLKVAKGSLKEALGESLTLEQTLLKELDSQEYLYVLNLYRIAVLQGRLGDKEEERASFERLDRIRSDPNAPASLKAACLSFLQGVTSQNMSLQDYLKQSK